jgi:glutamine amidotransferase
LKEFHPPLQNRFLPIGTTDSEKAFCWLMQQLSERFADRTSPPAWSELAPVLAEIAAGITRYGNFNFLLSNGHALYTHCSSMLYALERAHPFPTATLIDCDVSVDLGALNDEGDRMVIIATEPLTTEVSWLKFATGDMRVFVDGCEVWRHVNENTRAFPMPQPGGTGVERVAALV